MWIRQYGLTLIYFKELCASATPASAISKPASTVRRSPPRGPLGVQRADIVPVSPGMLTPGRLRSAYLICH